MFESASRAPGTPASPTLTTVRRSATKTLRQAAPPQPCTGYSANFLFLRIIAPVLGTCAVRLGGAKDPPRLGEIGTRYR
ncbi:hypothetical protein PSEUDO9AG_41255 [Pseudomonas sp. 9Ag]|nr:hypothetical protein PSEUDO9AG_41255 [Pseudomonas sp. 9Ag]